MSTVGPQLPLSLQLFSIRSGSKSASLDEIFSPSLGKIFIKIKWNIPKQAAECNYCQQWCFFGYSSLQIYLVYAILICFD